MVSAIIGGIRVDLEVDVEVRVDVAMDEVRLDVLRLHALDLTRNPEAFIDMQRRLSTTNGVPPVSSRMK